MLEKKEKNIRMMSALLLVFILMAALMYFLLHSRMKHSRDRHLQLITEQYEFAYNTIYGQYKKIAINASTRIIERYNLISIYQQLLTADTDEKSRLRSKLLSDIRPRYERLKNQDNVRQLHFYLPDNESFLRVHRPAKYGDNLSEYRETVNYVNTFKLPIDGFEVGRIYSGYRFVFPVISIDQKYLGSMEISFGPEVLTTALMEQYGVCSNFFIRDAVVKKKAFSSEILVNYRKSLFDGYFYDSQVLSKLKNFSNIDRFNQTPRSSTIKSVIANVQTGKAMSIYDSVSDMVFTSIPVFNPISHEIVAFLTVRSQSVFFKNENRYFRTVFFMSLMLFAMGLSSFFALYNKKSILEANAKQLKKQKQRLVDAQNTANLGHWEFNLVSRELNWSDQIFKIFELEAQSITPDFETFLEMVHPDDRDFVNSSYVEQVKDSSSSDIQHRILTSKGKEKWIREICSTEYDSEGNPLFMSGIMHDITEQHNVLTLLKQKHDMFMHGPVMIFTWQNKENWPVEYVSENVRDVLGYSASEFLNNSLPYLNCIHSDDLPRVIKELEEHLESKDSSFVHKPYRLISRNGDPVWVLDSTSLVLNSNGEVSHFHGYLVDVTMTMLMENEIFESKKHLEMVIESASLGTWDWNIITGEAIYNERWAEIIGYTTDEIKSGISPWKNRIHPDDIAEVNEKLLEHLEGRTSVYKTEHRLQHKSGKWVWVLSAGKVLERDEQGNPLHAVGIHLDITENKEAAQTLFENKEQEFKQRYVRAIDDIGLGLLVVDADYRVRDMNQTMINWFGDQRGKICFESVIGLKEPCPFCCLTDVLKSGNITKYRPEMSDGRRFDIVAVPLTNPEGTVSMMEVIRDVTEQEEAKTALISTNMQLEEAIFAAERMAEKAEEANHAKSVFLSTMGHELRTPLNAILGYTQIFSEDASLSKKVQIGVKTIQQSGEHLLLLLNDILDLSKIEAGKMKLVKSEFRLPEFLQGIMGIISLRAEEKGLNCYYTAETPIPAVIRTDELRLRQVILNLLSNAVKFTNIGYCALRIGSSFKGKNGASLTFTIEDTGIGIALEMQEKIFEVFQQTGQRLKYSEGYGLGLSISRKLVELMGGVLELTSPVTGQPEHGKDPGSCFSFTIDVGTSGELLEICDAQFSLELNSDHSGILAPPEKILDVLIKLAKSGDIDGIEEQTLMISQMEQGQYLHFSRRIKQLADKFKLIDIVKFVTRYKQD